ncbi:MFS transporter [Novosphingobium beihaiensis]|uniref:MFS transporter n=1 Tax=Novosphingobium beihaiensis TaxID=2930389 RepID=A0ABT0BMR7_9SPHN|nr:MFS transporter [Novosphingobium beihaiensis]MCJ2186347.1 MFS transporter [Novosphingobium beihaiensis]
MADLHQHPHGPEPSASDIRMVIAASSAGTIFEWYDFFIYGTLASFVGKAFFPSVGPTLQILLVWAGFAVGFGFRPLGAILFGYFGDKLGRKYTFLVTVTLMGISTAGVGLTPSAETIGLWAPFIVILLRILQGLALGGEYGGAAIYVSEHSPPGRRGYFTGFIQSSVVGGFVLSIIVVLLNQAAFSEDTLADWGWRVPFLLSLALLAISLWMRLKLSESPVFLAMREEGEISGNPFAESFTYPGNKKRIFVALFGVTGILTTIWYTAFFSSLSFLKGPMRVDATVVEVVIGLTALVSMSFYVMVGAWSDKVGRKRPLVIGAALALALLFPLFWGLGSLANPGLQASARANPVVVSGRACSTDPFADLTGSKPSDCGKLLETLTASGVPYSVRTADALSLTVGGHAVAIAPEWLAGDAAHKQEAAKARKAGIEAALAARGFDFSVQRPALPALLGIAGILLVLGGLSALTYGGVAAQLTEMFPAPIRYSSMSIPYHIGAGYLGGFLPLIASYINARTGDAYAGLWYTWGVVAFGLIVAIWGLRGGPPRDYGDDAS